MSGTSAAGREQGPGRSGPGRRASRAGAAASEALRRGRRREEWRRGRRASGPAAVAGGLRAPPDASRRGTCQPEPEPGPPGDPTAWGRKGPGSGRVLAGWKMTPRVWPTFSRKSWLEAATAPAPRLMAPMTAPPMSGHPALAAAPRGRPGCSRRRARSSAAGRVGRSSADRGRPASAEPAASSAARSARGAGACSGTRARSCSRVLRSSVAASRPESRSIAWMLPSCWGSRVPVMMLRGPFRLRVRAGH